MRWCGVVVAMVVLAGCGDIKTSPPLEVKSPVAPQVTERRVGVPAKTAGLFGASCIDGSQCASGICLHTDQSSRLEGRRCAVRCDSNHQCREGRASQIFPSEAGWFCLPEAR